MNDPSRLTSAARTLRAKTPVAVEQAGIELGFQATVMSPARRSTPRTWSDRIGLEMWTYSIWTKSPVPRLTHEETASTVTCLQIYRLGAPLTGMHVVNDACA